MNKIKELLRCKLECEACGARKEATQVVLPKINKSKVWILGRDPGIDEDRKGEPFVGRGGRKLDEWLLNLGYERSMFLIENVSACHKENDRQPLLEEIEACSYWLKKEMELLEPRLIICLGNVAFKLMIRNNNLSVVQTHGILMKAVFYPCMIFPLEHVGRALRSSLIDSQVVERDLPKLKCILKDYEQYMQ